MECQPQNSEFRHNPENFHPCKVFAKRSMCFNQVDYGLFIHWPCGEKTCHQTRLVPTYSATGYNFDPFIPNGFSHLNHLDEFISNFRVVGWYFSFFSNFDRKF